VRGKGIKIEKGEKDEEVKKQQSVK
jgi:hypothetical protein